MEILENIIVNLLLYSSHDMLEYFDDLELFLDYKFHIMKDWGREKKSFIIGLLYAHSLQSIIMHAKSWI